MKAVQIKRLRKKQGIWEDNDQPIINKLLEIEDRFHALRTSINVEGSYLEIKPEYLEKQKNSLKIFLSKIEGTFVYYTLQGFQDNFRKDYEAHCKKHGIEDEKAFLVCLASAYTYVLSEHELILEYATLLAYKKLDFFGEDGPEYPSLDFETYVKDIADKNKQTLIYHFEAIIEDIKNRLKTLEMKAYAVILESTHNIYSSTQNGLLQKQFDPRPFNRLVSSSLQNLPGSDTPSQAISSPQLDDRGIDQEHFDLFLELHKEYIIDNAIFDTFQNAMNDRDMPTKKMIWSIERGKPADAIRFCNHLGKDLEWWNSYFMLKNKKRLNTTNKSKTEAGKINSILSNCGYKDAQKSKETKAISKFRE